VSLTNNYIGFGAFGPYAPGSSTLATLTGNKIVDFSNPVYSTQAMAAYQAAGAPTATVVSATSSGSLSAGGSAPTTMLGNGFVGAHLFGGAGETNFVGGFGAQYLFGGQGVNIFTYLAISDGGDLVSYFDPAKDMIDLSHIDANITTPGVQNFKFIGSAPFSGGAQVRYQLNPTNNTTTVQAALAGDPTADFSITLAGLDPLTAANFALTPSQSAADLAAGAALTRSKVQTAAGAPTEYAYSNVQGRDYGSYQSFTGSSGIAAEYFNLSATAHELALYSPNLTVTRGGGSESLQVGTASDPLTYNTVETIDATTSGNEHFVLSAGFGKETIKGFVTSGTNSDTIQLAKSAFSYLTPGMTQAQDLAAVLTVGGAASSSGLTIADSHGDSLTLAGVTPAMIASNPGMFAFT
jgi:Peptidase M10 serralysin C terminal